MKKLSDLNKNSNEYMLRKLTPEMKEFIEAKVREIGSRKAAESFYTPAYGTKDLTSRYAFYCIRAIYGKEDS